MIGSMSSSAAPADVTSLLKLLNEVADLAQTKAALEQLSALHQAVAAERAAAITDANAARQDREQAERLRKEIAATETVITEREERLTALGTELADRTANLDAREGEFNANAKARAAALDAKEQDLA
jgi:hypothetical protein